VSQLSTFSMFGWTNDHIIAMHCLIIRNSIGLRICKQLWSRHFGPGITGVLQESVEKLATYHAFIFHFPTIGIFQYSNSMLMLASLERVWSALVHIVNDQLAKYCFKVNEDVNKPRNTLMDNSMCTAVVIMN
jgi:hypothetical protein